VTAREVLIITGMSGAGRSTVANALEDLGYYVVDNLPPVMLRQLVDVVPTANEQLQRLAIVVDVRGGVLFDDAMRLIEMLRTEMPITVVYLSASDATLVRRFEQVRRPHPLQGDGTILDGIRTERVRLSGIRDLADVLLDTSDINVHELTNRVRDRFSRERDDEVRLTVLSFGFKYGTPPDADLIADMRFLPNPFWQPELKAHTGLDEAVRDYVLAQQGAAEFADAYLAMLEPILAGYARENKRYAVLGIGCTGGKHRSVAMSEHLAARLAESGVSVTVQHRDLGRE
jgi:UPF0042 nucleotide-binding protein